MRVMLQGDGRCLEIRGEQAARSGKKHEKYLKETGRSGNVLHVRYVYKVEV